MNSTISQRMPGAASRIQNSLAGWLSRCPRRPARPGGAGVCWILAATLDAVTRHEPGLLPERVGVDGQLELAQAAAEVGRQDHRRHQAGRQDLLLYQDLRRDTRHQLHVPVEADV